MIGKGISIAHGREAIDYVLKKEGAELIDMRYCSGENGVEIMSEFRIFQDLNGRASNTEMSFVLSPEVAEGKSLSNDKYQEIAGDFLRQMGLEEHQAVIVKHNDRNHTHLHLIVNRIDMQGKCFKDHHIAWETQKQADKVAQIHHLKRAKDKWRQRDGLTPEIKKTIRQHHEQSINLSSDFNEYREQMKSRGVQIHLTQNKSGEIQGHRLEFDGQSFKASEISRKMTLSRLEFKSKSLEKRHNLEQEETPQKAHEISKTKKSATKNWYQNRDIDEEQNINHTRGI